MDKIIPDRLLDPSDNYSRREFLELFFLRRLDLYFGKDGLEYTERLWEELNYAEDKQLLQVVGLFAELCADCEEIGGKLAERNPVGNSLIAFLLGFQEEYKYRAEESYRVWFDRTASHIPVFYTNAATVSAVHPKIDAIFGKNRIAHPTGMLEIKEKNYRFIHHGIFVVSPVNTEIRDCMETENLRGFCICSMVPRNNDSVWTFAVFAENCRKLERLNDLFDE